MKIEMRDSGYLADFIQAEMGHMLTGRCERFEVRCTLDECGQDGPTKRIARLWYVQGDGVDLRSTLEYSCAHDIEDARLHMWAIRVIEAAFEALEVFNDADPLAHARTDELPGSAVLDADVQEEIRFSGAKNAVRIGNALGRYSAAFQTIGDLANASKVDLMHVENIGANSLLEIELMLRQRGLRIGMTRAEIDEYRRKGWGPKAS